MIVNVPRKKIIEAITKEKLLRHNSWIHPSLTEAWKKNVKLGGKYLDMETFMKTITVKEKDCPVCAVGAVLRNILDESTSIHTMVKRVIPVAIDQRSNVIGDSRNPKKFAEEICASGDYMTSLSAYFEALCRNAIYYQDMRKETTINQPSRHQIYRIKKKLASFVRENFPSVISLDIDGAKPAKDIKRA